MVILTLSLKEIQGAKANKCACCFDLLLDSDKPTGAERGMVSPGLRLPGGPIWEGRPRGPST